MQHPVPARRQAPPSGVIETLSAGYAAINRQLWVLLLPIVVDLFLWLGPQVSYSPLVDPMVTNATFVARQVAAGPPRAPRNPWLGDILEDTRLWLIARTGESNGLSVVAHGPVGPPSLAALPSARTDDLTFVTDWGRGGGLLLGSVLGSLALGGWFYRGLASATSGKRAGPLAAGLRTPRDVLRVIGLVGAVIGIGLLLGLPVLMLVIFTALVAPIVAALGVMLLLVAVVYTAIHLFFAVDAIFVSNVGPLEAVQRSVSVVRRYLWPSVALVALTWLILVGMARFWVVLAGNVQFPYGIALSILGNAYIASGLIAAGMIFYLERADNPEPVGAPIALSPS